MGKTNWTIILVIAGIIGILLYLHKGGFVGAVTGSETMTRTVPTTVNPSSSFTLTYTAIGTSGSWGATIEDAVTGGCLFPSGSNTYRTVMLSEDGNTKSITMTAPSSGSCTFSGDYKYGSFPIVAFPSKTVAICQPSCVRPANLCLATSSNGCGGTCTWIITKNTNADTNCDNIVNRDELGVYIQGWVDGAVTRTQLGEAIQSWAVS